MCRPRPSTPIEAVSGEEVFPCHVCVVWPRLSVISSAMRYCPCTRFEMSQFATTVVPVGVAGLAIGTHEPPGSSARPLPLTSYQYMNCAETNSLTDWQFVTVR